MSKSNSRNPCAAGCAQCETDAFDRDGCAPQGSSLRGWRLTLSASGAFWIPVALATVGAVGGGGSPVWQLIGAGIGLVVGMAGAGAVVRLIRPADEEGAWQQH